MSGGPTPFAALDSEYRKLQADHEALVRAVRRRLRTDDGLLAAWRAFNSCPQLPHRRKYDLACWMEVWEKANERARAQLEALIRREI
jgi:hypothetical protein